MKDEKDSLIERLLYTATHQQMEILKLLIRNDVVTKQRILFNLWAAAGEEEPATAREVIAVQLTRLKGHLTPFGWAITTVRRGGGRGDKTGSVYKLEKGTR